MCSCGEHHLLICILPTKYSWNGNSSFCPPSTCEALSNCASTIQLRFCSLVVLGWCFGSSSGLLDASYGKNPWPDMESIRGFFERGSTAGYVFFPKWKHSQWSTVNLQPDVAWWIHSEMQSLVPNYDSPAPLWRLQHADLAWGTSWPRGSPWTAWAQRNGHALWISHRRCKATTSQKDNSMSRSPWRSLITV